VRRNGIVSVFYYSSSLQPPERATGADPSWRDERRGPCSVTRSGTSTPAGYVRDRVAGRTHLHRHGSAGSCAITGLEGVPYTFTAIAENSAGVSTSSPPRTSDTGFDDSDEPHRESRRLSSIVASWTPPTSTGVVVGYTSTRACSSMIVDPSSDPNLLLVYGPGRAGAIR